MFFHVPKFLRARAAMTEQAKPNEFQPPRLQVRWMIHADMSRVLEIEGEAFEFPWREDDFIRCLRQHNVIGLAVDDLGAGRTAGFAIYENRRGSSHVLSLAVAAEFRRRGAARAILERLKMKLTPRRSRIFLEVRETNLAAQLCFRQLGFRAISVLRDFYEDSSEDAYLFEWRKTPQPRFEVPGSRFQA